MKQHHLSIQARFRPELLERILRVTRHRGFRVCALNMLSAAHSDQVTIQLTVSSQRSLSLLTSQLQKLLDVLQVEIRQYTPQQTHA